jgi:osmotically-inducible protein OsmY
MMDPDRFFIQVHEGVAVLEGRVERRSLLPLLVRAVRSVEGVVQVEDRLAYDIDDRDGEWVKVSPWMHL